MSDGAAVALLTWTGQHEDAIVESGERRHDFNRDWLFGGRYVGGAEQPGYDDRYFARVALPHTVTDLSWNDWDFEAWEHVWIYRKHLDGAMVTGGRVLLTFDGVTVTFSGAGTVDVGITSFLKITQYITAASNPTSSTSHRHLSSPPAIPTARQPLIRAICPAILPTEPAAPETTTV